MAVGVVDFDEIVLRVRDSNVSVFGYCYATRPHFAWRDDLDALTVRAVHTQTFIVAVCDDAAPVREKLDVSGTSQLPSLSAFLRHLL